MVLFLRPRLHLRLHLGVVVTGGHHSPLVSWPVMMDEWLVSAE